MLVRNGVLQLFIFFKCFLIYRLWLFGVTWMSFRRCEISSDAQTGVREGGQTDSSPGEKVDAFIAAVILWRNLSFIARWCVEEEGG